MINMDGFAKALRFLKGNRRAFHYPVSDTRKGLEGSFEGRGRADRMVQLDLGTGRLPPAESQRVFIRIKAAAAVQFYSVIVDPDTLILVASCIEIPGYLGYQDPPVLNLIFEFFIIILPLRSFVTKNMAEPWALT